MNAINTDNLLTQPEINDLVLEVYGKSKVQQVAKQIRMGDSGVILQDMHGKLAEFVVEGAKKPVINPTFTNWKLEPFKIARIVVTTEEALRVEGALEALMLTELSDSIAHTFDTAFFGGDAAVPTKPVGFDSLTSITDAEVVISGYTSFIQAMAPKAGKRPDHIFLNSELLTELQMIVNDHQSPILVFGSSAKYDGTINNVSYTIIEVPGVVTPVGYTGPFTTRLLWGVVPGSVSIRKSNEATVVVDGVVVSLWQENKIAFLCEASYACKAYNLNGEFKKISASA